jgi:hypothetical protein
VTGPGRIATADSPAKQRYKTDTHSEQVTGVGLGEKLTVWVGREKIEGSLYAVPAQLDGTPVTVHVIVVGQGRVVVPWHAISKIEATDARG